MNFAIAEYQVRYLGLNEKFRALPIHKYRDLEQIIGQTFGVFLLFEIAINRK